MTVRELGSAFMGTETMTALRQLVRQMGGRHDPSALDDDGLLALELMNAARVLVVLLDDDGRLVYANPLFQLLCGFGEEELVGLRWGEVCRRGVITAGGRDAKPAQSVHLGAGWRVEGVCAPGGVTRLVEWNDRPIQSTAGKGGGTLRVGRDVTDLLARCSESVTSDTVEARRVREELELTEQLLEGSFNSSTVALAYLDRDMNFLRVNDTYASADRKTPAFFVGKNHFDLFPDEENEQIFARVRDTGVPHAAIAKPFEYAHNPERGTTHWDWTLTPVSGRGGKVVGLLLALRNVTARLQAIEALKVSEERVTRQLAEKEALLYEVHHRVKNNLQVVSSLLFLQAGDAGNAEVERELRDACGRIQAMSLVHEVLCADDRLDRIDVAMYLTRLIEAIQATQGGGGAAVQIECDVSVPALGVDRSVACGLIASELITNAMKHAFVGRSAGRVWVGMRSVSDELVQLEVLDDGVGFGDTPVDGLGGLGLRLVNTLVGQLDGSLEVGSPRGARVRVEFPLEERSRSGESVSQGGCVVEERGG